MFASFRKKFSLNWFMLIIVLLALAPLFTTGYYDMLLGKAIILAIFAISLDLAWGYGGILSLGHSIFFGLGAYAFSIAALNGNTGAAFVVGIVLALLLPTLLAAAAGWFLFYEKLDPFYVGVITLSLTLIAEKTVLLFPKLTGGQNGLYNIPLPFTLSGKSLYFVILVIFIVVLYFVNKLSSSDFGKLLVATRDNELRAQFLGYNTAFVHTLIFIISGFLAGFAGLLYAPYVGFVGPGLFTMAFATQVIIWVAIGGRGRIIGAVIGALIINMLTPVFNEISPYLWQIFLGGTFVAVVVFRPDGLTSLWGKPKDSAAISKISITQKPQLSSDDSNKNSKLFVTDLNVSFGALSVLENLCLTINPSELLCIVGPNGAGKSTLVNAITGLVKTSKGDILLEGERLTRFRPYNIVNKGAARTFQSANVFGTLTVADNLFLASNKGLITSFWRRSREIKLSEPAKRLLNSIGLSEKLHEEAGNLSHGEQKSLELCMVLALEPRVLLLDEPTAGLALQERKIIGDILINLVRSEELAMVVIEHDIEFVKSIADRIAVLHNGDIIVDGNIEEVTSNSLVKEIYLGVEAV
ncbi:MAG: branched-chain amino acid ABC transporter ATP-binding protein/permease [Firmicutes bacterium]|nr:branched-chain amino acid ABC transporter ATP-binding protein/permease [Bacillota bacterium]